MTQQSITIKDPIHLKLSKSSMTQIWKSKNQTARVLHALITKTSRQILVPLQLATDAGLVRVFSTLLEAYKQTKNGLSVLAEAVLC